MENLNLLLKRLLEAKVDFVLIGMPKRFGAVVIRQNDIRFENR